MICTKARFQAYTKTIQNESQFRIVVFWFPFSFDVPTLHELSRKQNWIWSLSLQVPNISFKQTMIQKSINTLQLHPNPAKHNVGYQKKTLNFPSCISGHSFIFSCFQNDHRVDRSNLWDDKVLPSGWTFRMSRVLLQGALTTSLGKVIKSTFF